MRRGRTTTLAGFALYLAISLALNSGAVVTVHEVSKPRHPWLGNAIKEIRVLARPRLADAELDWVKLPEEMSHIEEPPEKEPAPKVPDHIEVAILKEPPKKLPKPEPKPKPASPKLAVVPAPPPKVEKPKAKKKAIVAERHISVEVDDDKNVVNEPPPEAKFLSDKNRRVAEETMARDTNLERASKSKNDASAKSQDDQNPDVGGKDHVIAQLEDAEASSLDAKRELLASVHNGKKDYAKDLMSGVRGRGGDEGDRGDEGDGRAGKNPGLLSMRNLDGRTSEGKWAPSIERVMPGNNEGPDVAQTLDGRRGNAGMVGKKGKKGRRGPKLRLDNQDYERIMGHDQAREEVEVARRTMSHRKGRWAKKLARVQASLENFTPNVRPGNQTALGTRAAPFAVYLSQMHRRIHELWGFGFLAELGDKGPGHPLNDYSLKVKIEIVLLTDGSVDQVTIVYPSPKLTFDVAAVDTVYSAGPFGAPPPEIRSGNGKVYMQWTFHRNEYQCSSYFAEPYILDNPPPGSEADKMVSLEETIRARKVLRAERLSRERGSPTKGSVIVPRVHRHEPGASEQAAAARVNANLPTPDDPNAQAVAGSWLRAFRSGDVDALIALSGTPFESGGIIVAKTQEGLRPIYKTIIEETQSRRVLQFKLVSAAGYRKLFGHVPRSGENGTSSLYFVIKLSKEVYTLMLTQIDPETYRVTGFQR